MKFTDSSISGAQKERWTENFARFGIVSKGVVYCLIGFLTSLAAFGLGGEKADKNEAFKLIYEQPLGRVILFIVAIGLLGYVTWRFFQSVFDIDYKGKDAKAKLVRLGYGFSALLYLSIAIYAAKLAVAGPGGDDKDSQHFIVVKILSLSAGEWIIGIAGLITVGIGIRQIYNAVTGNFMKNVTLHQSTHAQIFKKTGIAGYISRGVVLIIIGYFFLRAAIHHNANEAVGTRGAFSFLENNFGSLLMGLVALGLIGYGIFMFVKGKYQRIDVNF